MKVKLLLASLLLASTPLMAHQTSTSYVFVSDSDKAGIWQAQWQVDIRDLELKMQLDTNNDGEILWQEIMLKEPQLHELAQQAFVADKSQCSVSVKQPLMLTHHHDHPYIDMSMLVDCQGADNLAMQYQGFFDANAGHKAVVLFDGKTQILSSKNRSFNLKRKGA